jgi:integrase
MNAEHRIPLTDDVIAVLETLPRWREDYLFSNDGTRPVRFQCPPRDKLVAAMRAELGNVPPWILHDIRRTVRTRLSELRVQDHVAELVIGHSRKGIGRVYDLHRYLDEMREAQLGPGGCEALSIRRPTMLCGCKRAEGGKRCFQVRKKVVERV